MTNVREIDGLVAIVSVIRPGAANETKKLTFTRRYQGMEEISYPHPCLEPCLKSTFGLVVYEEHILQISELFAGLSGGRADVLRRGLVKQRANIIGEIGKEFFASARARGHGDAKIKEVWELVTGFSGYALVPNAPTNQSGAVAPKSFYDDYGNNSYQLGQGQTLYENYNCNTCHAHGGGDIGPPLKDNKWIYGYEPQQIFASIAQGRPKGMPAFGSRLTENQIWELVAYVRSLSGLTPKTIAPGRDEHMQTGPAPNSIKNPPPENAFAP